MKGSGAVETRNDVDFSLLRNEMREVDCLGRTAIFVLVLTSDFEIEKEEKEKGEDPSIVPPSKVGAYPSQAGMMHIEEEEGGGLRER